MIIRLNVFNAQKCKKFVISSKGELCSMNYSFAFLSDWISSWNWPQGALDTFETSEKKKLGHNNNRAWCCR